MKQLQHNQALPPNKTAGKQADGMSLPAGRQALVRYAWRVVGLGFH
jgi:hypothetical protein